MNIWMVEHVVVRHNVIYDKFDVFIAGRDYT
jgi:hypothetical protein